MLPIPKTQAKPLLSLLRHACICPDLSFTRKRRRVSCITNSSVEDSFLDILVARSSSSLLLQLFVCTGSVFIILLLLKVNCDTL